MYSIKIDFPFSNINDENYVLTLYASRNGAFANAIDAMDADTRCFSKKNTQTIDGNAITSYEGTLVGDVIAEDDDREDVFQPLVASKLKFNLACQQFPTWLMDICDYYTNVKVVLCAKSGMINIERWRGYLMANTLNMTVVNEMMACPLVAVDEVGIAKYLKFKENYSPSDATPSLLSLFGTYWTLNHTNNFADLYSLLGLTASGNLFVAHDLQYRDHNGNLVNNILALCVNLERFFLDRDATWGDVFSDICTFIGVAFCIGGTSNGGNDRYILSGTDYWYNKYLIYTFGSSAYTQQSSRLFADLGNQAKVGGDLQCTYKPCEWKGVKVKSTPSRPPIHKYLENDNVKAIPPASGHAEWCETRIGKNRSNLITIDEYKYRVFQYAEIVDKEDQWISEAEYVSMENCNLASDARVVGMTDGCFPLTDAALGHLRPQPTDVDSMDFALSKWGMIVAKIGSYETPRQKISANLNNYFVILNNKWGREYWNSDNIVSAVDYTAAVIGTLYPFAGDKSIRPNNESFLSIDFSALFLNENIGSDVRIIENNALQSDLKGKIQSVFPIFDSFHDWSDTNDDFNGSLVESSHNAVNSYYPYVIARLSIGNYYWDGSAWVYKTGSVNLPTFNLPLIPTGSPKWYNVSTGYMHGEVDNYYYVECRPRVGTSDNVFRIPLTGLSTSLQPLSGQVKLEIFGRVPFFNGYDPTIGDTRFNNILMVLISDIEIKFTDEAYYIDGKDIDTVGKTIVDANSTTKKLKEVDINMSSPTIEGVFDNCLVYDDGAKWVNLQKLIHGGKENTAEEILSKEMAAVMCDQQAFIEFSRNFDLSSGDIYNVGLTVNGLTEMAGYFAPLTRKFNWTKGFLRWKMQKVTVDDPGDVSKYIQSGLMLHMDGKLQGDTANAWTSLVGGYKFTATGSPVFNADNVQFDGSSRLGNNSFTAPLADGATIEVVFESTGETGVIFSPTASSKKIAAGLFTSGFLWNIYSNGRRYPVISNGSVSVNADRCLYNGVPQTSNGNSYFGSSTALVNSIGCRYNSGSYNYFFTGKIYSIRIYNRKLSESEMLQNLNVDRARFNIGL